MIDQKRLLDTFRQLVSYDAESFHEGRIKEYLKRALTELGLSVEEDDAASALRERGAEAGLPLQRDKARGKETDEDPVSGCWRRSTGAFARSFWRWPKPSLHGSVKCSGGPEEYCEKKTPAAPVPERERAPRARFSVRRSITDRDAEADQQQHEQEVCEKERQALSDPGEIIHLDH